MSIVIDKLRRVFGISRSKDGEFLLSDSSTRKIIDSLRDSRITYLTRKKLASIATTCAGLEAANTPGRFIECGCALGGSAILISKLKNVSRPLDVYDVFGMIPPPSEEDTHDVHERYRTIAEGESVGIGGDTYYGYETDLLECVEANFQNFGVNRDTCSVSLIKGLVQDTLLIDHTVAFAHIDVDWYEPVKICLERIFPRLVSGGSIILDDYHDWGGCRKAVDEFFSQKSELCIFDDTAGSLKITKL